MISLSVHAYEHLTGEFEVVLTIQDYQSPGERGTTLYSWRGQVPPPLSGEADSAMAALLAVFDACREAYDRGPF